MKKVLIFGNSGSGKSTLARALCAAENLAHLDLDTLAWMPAVPPVRKPLEAATREIVAFIDVHQAWVIEGCYSDLLSAALPYANEMIYMNLPVDACVANAASRPWEPHKYESKEAQDQNLEMLIAWIKQYDERNDLFSRSAHNLLYESYAGTKQAFTANPRIN